MAGLARLAGLGRLQEQAPVPAQGQAVVVLG
jgi:hypothetical protein